MVKIAIAGGTGDVGQEIIDVLVATKRHDILLLSRKDVPAEVLQGVTWVKVDYNDPKQLAEILKGVETVFSFITVQNDPGNVAQKNLINAAVQAGVKRYAPNEWAGTSYKHMDFSVGKLEIREYLKELNKDKKVLEYSLFQCGVFEEYFTHPYKSAKHLVAFELHIDFNKRRAITLEGGDDNRITLTTTRDLANVVARAVEYEGEWPLIGGIKGTDFTIGQLIALGEKIRGPFDVERLSPDDLKAGVVKASWKPRVTHAAVPPEQVDALSGMFLASILLNIGAEGLYVSDEWNQLLPDYKFTQAEDFLTEAWRGKP